MTNKLAFPAGRAYGIDPNHPAGRPVAHWVTELPCTPTSDCFRIQRDIVGETWALPTDASGATNKILVGTQNNSTIVTFAAIFTNHNFKVGRTWCANEAGNRGLGLTNNNPCCYSNLSNLLQCGPSDTYTAGPIFIAYSYMDNGPWNAIRRDLRTGRIYTSSGTLGVGAVATDNTFGVTFIGQLWNGNEHATFNIAAFAKTLNYVGPGGMRFWAEDPWGYWRPRHRIIHVGSLISAKTLTADSGSYSLTGSAASLLLKRQLAAAAGSYALTGTTANLKVGKKVAAAAGSYQVSGVNASLLHGWKVAAAAGSYSITGQTASLLHKWILGASAGAYNITGSVVGLLKPGNKILAADAGSYSISGQAASLLHKWIATALSGSYSINGQSANLKLGRKVAALAGAYSINGINANLIKGKRIALVAGAYTLTGNDATLLLRHNKFVDALVGAYLLGGVAVTLNYHSLNPPRTRTSSVRGAGVAKRSPETSFDLRPQDDFDLRPPDDFGKRNNT